MLPPNSNAELATHHPTPDALVLFITGRCNAHCGHCFYAEQLNNDDDGIDRDSLGKLLASLNRPTALSLTGGEPFARADFGDLAEQILESPLIHSLSINTNGFLPSRTTRVLNALLSRSQKPIRLQLSLDGNETSHDQIRGVPGGFQKTLQTAHWLKSRALEAPSLSSTLSITVMRANLAEIEPLVGFLLGEGLRTKVTFVRGNSFSTFAVPATILNPEYQSEELPASPDQLRLLVDSLDARYPGFFDEYAHRKLDAALYTLTHRKRQVPCLAGDHDGVIYHDGHVGICEQVMPFGHLSEWDWHLDRAWNSAKANAHRAQLRHCACIHGCNLSTGVAHLMASEAARKQSDGQ